MWHCWANAVPFAGFLTSVTVGQCLLLVSFEERDKEPYAAEEQQEDDQTASCSRPADEGLAHGGIGSGLAAVLVGGRRRFGLPSATIVACAAAGHSAILRAVHLPSEEDDPVSTGAGKVLVLEMPVYTAGYAARRSWLAVLLERAEREDTGLRFMVPGGEARI